MLWNHISQNHSNKALHWNVAISQGLRSLNFLAFSSRETHTRKTGFDPKWRVQFYRHRQTGRLPPGHRNFWCLLKVRCYQSRVVPCFGICPEVWSKHINLYLNRTILLWKRKHIRSNRSVHEIRQAARLSERDWKKGYGRKWRSSLHCESFWRQR